MEGTIDGRIYGTFREAEEVGFSGVGDMGRKLMSSQRAAHTDSGESSMFQHPQKKGPAPAVVQPLFSYAKALSASFVKKLFIAWNTSAFCFST
ncbi:hypothetical protein DWY22_09925 [Heyndrickxia coagulans]|nr:hypothetical protein DWY22_09925 [Heyndrickxia coagulans]